MDSSTQQSSQTQNEENNQSMQPQQVNIMQDIIAKHGSSGWDELYKMKKAVWDKGEVSPALRELIEEKKFPLPDGRGLVPGCGKGYDVFYFANKKRHMTGLDLSETVIDEAKMIQAELKFSEETTTFQAGDFFNFEISEGKFQLVYDYTFLCALPPTLRQSWGTRMSEIISPGGILIALMYPISNHTDGPPFAVSESMYDIMELLGKNFTLEHLDKNCKSFPGRQGRETMSVWKRI
ncbi:6958_t:CDS:2 [Acaulospora morrowiae]|uniref:6958_t:CDS:1 n=1 Tax=Acaulospora morrowiae TaxID=94023 RepID=A0A9N9GC97_9GLOM|nr:6958_t:CDS:2 [Acaulospora morrowiae]